MNVDINVTSNIVHTFFQVKNTSSKMYSIQEIPFKRFASNSFKICYKTCKERKIKKVLVQSLLTTFISFLSSILFVTVGS